MGFNYDIVENDELFQELEEAPQLKMDILRCYDWAILPKEQNIVRIKRKIKNHPDSPILKNYLSVLYNNLNRKEEADKVTVWIVEKHPDYLFGKLNLAVLYFLKEKHEKIKELLGEDLLIEKLYPKRKKFHITEVLGFFKCTCLYYAAIGEIKKSDIALNKMKELDSEADAIFFCEQQLALLTMKRDLELRNKNRIEVKNVTQKREQIENPPVFKTKEVEGLFKEDINDVYLVAALKLPEKDLVKDLELILIDGLQRYEYYANQEEKQGFSDSDNMALFYAIYLLGDSKSYDSLPLILEVLSQDEDFLDFYFGDFITEFVWQPLYKLADEKLAVLKQFMFKPGVYTYAKSEVAEAVCQLGKKQPQKTNEVLSWYKNVLEFYLNAKLDDNVIDSDLIALIISNLIDLEGEELLPIVKELFQKNRVSESMPGNFERISDLLNKKEKREGKRIVMSAVECFQFNDTIDMGGEYDLGEDKEEWKETPEKAEKKVGRNDPCSCGSGKKYKKCCL